jgi:hypothetical protein
MKRKGNKNKQEKGKKTVKNEAQKLTYKDSKKSRFYHMNC